MESELDKLCRDLKRYRFLLSANTDRQADQVIRELIAESEVRLPALCAAPTAIGASGVLPLPNDGNDTGFGC